MRHYNETDRAVWEYLQSIGVKFESVYQGGRVDNDNGNKWEHDLFTVRFTRGKSVMETDYRQGIGHRVTSPVTGLGREAEDVGASGQYATSAVRGGVGGGGYANASRRAPGRSTA